MKMVARLSLLFLSAILVSSCSSLGGNKWEIPSEPEPAKVQYRLLEQRLREIEPPIRQPSVAVYSFTDQTGQKRQNASGGTSFSSAVTQAPDVYLIRALTRAAKGKFFRVIDRQMLDALTKERQLIRQTRDSYQGKGAKKLPALTFAGMIIAGGIVGYDHATQSGGAGARYLGIGSSREYSRDTVTINIRLVSVATGEVLLDVITSKTILSTQYGGDVFRYVEQGTRLVEVESGVTTNESVSIATQRAIETGVLELIERGNQLGYWTFKGE
jgi:curli production assembly/transport component CsgG